MKKILMTVLAGLLHLGSTAADQPNILLIVSEDNGPELGCYGDPYAQTPNLDKLAEEGVRFERAFVPYSVCSPSRTVFLTGLDLHQNGVPRLLHCWRGRSPRPLRSGKKEPRRLAVSGALSDLVAAGISVTRFSKPDVLDSENRATSC